MYEDMTYERLLQEKLNSVAEGLDKRQGSIIYDTMAPNAAESAKLYLAMEMLMDRTFADTATGEDLERRTAERNVKRKNAVKAQIKGEFYNTDGNLFDISTGDRFLCGICNYVAIEKIETGIFKLECETAGEVGNHFSNRLTAVEYIEGLSFGRPLSILIYGEDEEKDESLRKRYFDSFTDTAFGGNIDDYKRFLGEMDCVGGIKIYAAYNGGGTVKAVITNNGYTVPEREIVEKVQEAVDPIPKGNGLGIAPIGHDVKIEAVTGESINVSFKATFETGYTAEKLKEEIADGIEKYFAGLREKWSECSNIIVRTSYIEMAVLDIGGIVDIENTKINGVEENYRIDADSIPLLGVVEIS